MKQDNLTSLNFGYINPELENQERRKVREFAGLWMSYMLWELEGQGLFSRRLNQPLALLYKVVRGHVDFCSLSSDPRAYFDYGVLEGRGHDGLPAAVVHASNAARKLPIVLGGGTYRSSLEVAGLSYVHPHLPMVEPTPVGQMFPAAPWGVIVQGGAVLVGSRDLHVAAAFAGLDEELDHQLALAFADALFLRLTVPEEELTR
jgi:hypothetical protein